MPELQRLAGKAVMLQVVGLIQVSQHPLLELLAHQALTSRLKTVPMATRAAWVARGAAQRVQASAAGVAGVVATSFSLGLVALLALSAVQAAVVAVVRASLMAQTATT